MNHEMNADRFSGFAEIYDGARPAIPDYPVNLITRYIVKPLELVVDLGCGTGLSSEAWLKVCRTVIGVEPNTDMLAIAQKKASKNLEFIKAFSHDTGLAGESADAVVCSQSFHWMEPKATLNEVSRILKPGGVFAVIDCDWPPVSVWEADKAYEQLESRVKQIEKGHPDLREKYIRYAKEKHLSRIKNSQLFRYAREIVFSNTEKCSPGRYVNILLSQGGLQSILKNHPELLWEDIAEFKKEIASIFCEKSFIIDFSYRMRIAIK